MQKEDTHNALSVRYTISHTIIGVTNAWGAHVASLWVDVETVPEQFRSEVPPSVRGNGYCTGI